ncbi:MAG: PAS domain-containing protein [Vicinamibacterales bacterium]
MKIRLREETQSDGPRSLSDDRFLSEDGGIRFVNAAGRALLGLSPQPPTSTLSLEKCVSPEDRDAAREALARVAQTDASADITMRLMNRKTGEPCSEDMIAEGLAAEPAHGAANT